LTRVKDTFDFSGAGSAAWTDFAEIRPIQKIPKNSKSARSTGPDRIDAEVFIYESFARGKNLSMGKAERGELNQ
jgi:hypothetical protein